MKVLTLVSYRYYARPPALRASQAPEWVFKAMVVIALTLAASSMRAQGQCGVTTYASHAGVHQALFIRDPAGEQTAAFDLAWGGTLASLTYPTSPSPVERIWGYDTGAMVQPAWFGPMANGEFYNPQQSGDIVDAGAPVLAAACNSTPLAFIISGAVDYNRGASGITPGNVVAGGVLRSDIYAAPYVITTYARFVSNPSGPPSYYLQLQQTIANADPSENFVNGFSLAGYVPHSYSNTVRYPANCITADQAQPCKAASTSALVGGLYPNAGLTDGVAFSTSPSTYWAPENGNVFVSLYSDEVNLNRATNLFANLWVLPPGTSRTISWYVMVGDWSKALAFAQTHP